MLFPMIVHITAGTIGLIVGYTALFADKGATLHRKAGMMFVFAMTTMAVFGMLLAAALGEWEVINLPAGWTTAYLAVTALTTVRRPKAWSHRLDVALMVIALGLGTAMFGMGMQAVAAGGSRDGIPAFPFFLFAFALLLAGVGDLRVLRSGALRGPQRLARHLWRMCFALFIAAMSFFFGQADVIPEALRIPALLALPVLAVLASMLYWLWRVRIRKSLRGMIGLADESRSAPVLSRSRSMA